MWSWGSHLTAGLSFCSLGTYTSQGTIYLVATWLSPSLQGQLASVPTSTTAKATSTEGPLGSEGSPADCYTLKLSSTSVSGRWSAALTSVWLEAGTWSWNVGLWGPRIKEESQARPMQILCLLCGHTLPCSIHRALPPSGLSLPTAAPTLRQSPCSRHPHRALEMGWPTRSPLSSQEAGSQGAHWSHLPPMRTNWL